MVFSVAALSGFGQHHSCSTGYRYVRYTHATSALTPDYIIDHITTQEMQMHESLCRLIPNSRTANINETDGDHKGGDNECSISASTLSRVFRGAVVATKTPDDIAVPIDQWISSCGGKGTSDHDATTTALRPEEWCNAATLGLSHEDSRQLARVAIGVAVLREKARRSQHATAADLAMVWDLVRGAITHPMTTGPRFSAARSSQGFLAYTVVQFAKGWKHRRTLSVPHLASGRSARQSRLRSAFSSSIRAKLDPCWRGQGPPVRD
ncbi:hypothetical protein F5141DRAFT_406403 [Pisolithus sp. B1]|nr:hypothetical protein F5141DRAFT_406403 [Pisolithus sp. B1]